jgi:nucleotide-binding universal stress UspA family protein
MTEALRLRTIIVAMDFSKASERALETAGELAKSAGPAHVMLVHGYYIPPDIEAFVPDKVPSYLEMLSEQATRALQTALVGLQDAGISAEYVALRGSPDEVVVKLAKDKDADLIVMGTHGRTGLAHWALGSVAERVVQHAHCPVLTVKADEA